MSSGSDGRHGTLVFDGDCGFCTTSARWLERHGSCEVVAWQHLDLAAAGLTEQQVTDHAWWLDDGRATAYGAEAISRSLRTCSAVYRLLGRLIWLPPVRPLARRGYDLVARNRHRLPGGTPACTMP